MKPKFRIDDEFVKYMCQTDSSCDEELEKTLVADGGPRDKLIVGELPGEDRVLVDGHRRFRVCEKHGLHFEVEVLHFASRDEVFDFMDRLALSRRNLPTNEQALIRGRMQRRRAGNTNTTIAAAEVAAEQGVSERTVWRDAKYAKAVENLDPAIRDKVVKELPKKDAIELAKKPRELQAKALKDRPQKTKSPPKEKPTDIVSVIAKAGKTVAVLQNQLEDCHRICADAIRLKTAKGYAKRIGPLLDDWGTEHD